MDCVTSPVTANGNVLIAFPSLSALYLTFNFSVSFLYIPEYCYHPLYAPLQQNNCASMLVCKAERVRGTEKAINRIERNVFILKFDGNELAIRIHQKITKTDAEWSVWELELNEMMEWYELKDKSIQWRHSLIRSPAKVILIISITIKSVPHREIHMENGLHN